MNIDNERKAFLYELNGHGYHFKNTDWHEDWERFEDEQLNMVWEMWLASANREGYKLVPVDSLKEIIDCAYCHIYDRCIGDEGDDVIKHILAMGVEDDH